jgi:hypothetical protein
MFDALRVIRLSLKDFWEEFVLLVMLNIVWTLAAVLPLAPLFLLQSVDLGILLLLSLVLALPLPIVTAALCFVTNQISRGKIANWGTFMLGVRRYWAKGLVLMAVNLAALILFVVNLQFYAVMLEGSLAFIVLTVWVTIGLYWLLVQVFWFPMILELESEKILSALRNALIMVVVTPGFSVVLGFSLLLLIALSILLTVPAVLVTTSMVFLIINHATRSRLAFAKQEPYPPPLE